VEQCFSLFVRQFFSSLIGRLAQALPDKRSYIFVFNTVQLRQFRATGHELTNKALPIIFKEIQPQLNSFRPPDIL
jgi:hypothetical protein